MITFLSKLYWKLYGWKTVGALPTDIKKMLLVIAPHTNWKDILIGFAVRDKLNIRHAKFLGKKELFEGPFGKWLLNLGGIPIDRKGKLGAVEQVASYYNSNEAFIVGISPEGTRKRVDTLKTGFYHMAKKANVPMVLVGFDFKNKEVLIGDPIYASENEEEDFKNIIAFFSTIQGATPENDLTHLKGNTL